MNDDQTNQQVEDIFDKDILELLGGENLPPEEKQKLYDKMLETIRFRVIASIDEMLSDEDREQWKNLFDTADQNQIDLFLKQRNIDIAKLMAEEALKYKMEMVTYADYLKKTGQAASEANKALNPNQGES
jgi:hypothetical protein